MATILSQFDTYMIGYTARGQGTQIAAAYISCFQQGTEVAQIQFLPDSPPFNTGGGLATGGEVVLYYESQQFQDVLAIIDRLTATCEARHPMRILLSCVFTFTPGVVDVSMIVRS